MHTRAPKTADRIRRRQAIANGLYDSTWYNKAMHFNHRQSLLRLLREAARSTRLAALYAPKLTTLAERLESLLLTLNPEAAFRPTDATTRTQRDAYYDARDVAGALIAAYDYLHDVRNGPQYEPVIRAFYDELVRRFTDITTDTAAIGRIPKLPPWKAYAIPEGTVVPPKPPSTRKAEREEWHKRYGHIVSPYLRNEITLEQYKKLMDAEKGKYLED